MLEALLDELLDALPPEEFDEPVDAPEDAPEDPFSDAPLDAEPLDLDSTTALVVVLVVFLVSRLVLGLDSAFGASDSDLLLAAVFLVVFLATFLAAFFLDDAGALAPFSATSVALLIVSQPRMS